jgi:hypothetical protein
MTTTSAPGRILSLVGKDYLFFGGTAYSGLLKYATYQETPNKPKLDDFE